MLCSNSVTTDFVAMEFPPGEVQPSNTTHFQVTLLKIHPHLLSTLTVRCQSFAYLWGIQMRALVKPIIRRRVCRNAVI